MQTLELKKGLYWAGILDSELEVFDIIMRTEFGTTYNSYLLFGSEKTALFETAKEKFFDLYLEKLQSLTDVSKIDYLIVNHTEPDHAGSIGRLLDLNPNLKIVGTAGAIGFLKQIVNRDFYSIVAKDDATLSLGDKTLRFLSLPNLHWPDTMYTYVEEDKVLFTCDSFGAHYSHDGILRSTVTDEEGYLRAAKYYFDCILGPFRRPYMTNALRRTELLPVDMICPGHGPVLDSHIGELREIYKGWCEVSNPNTKKTVVIPYVSAYGYTGMLADAVSRGISDSGDVDVKAYDLVEADAAQVLEQIGYADGVLFGTPTILGDALKPIWDLTTSMLPTTHSGKLASAFGSYGWSGEGVPNIIERLKQLKLKVLDGFRIRFRPSENELTDAYEFGYNFGCVLQNKENDKLRKPGEKRMVKCLVCGAVFEEGTKTCPVCGVGPDNFVPVSPDEVTFRNDTEDIYLVLGSGTAAVTAAEAIRARDKTGSIVLLTADEALPYNRPMLTKNMFAGLDDEQLAIHPESWYKENNICLMRGKRIALLDPEAHEVKLDDGACFRYSRCIYALGAESFVPSVAGSDLPQVAAIRGVEDIAKVAGLLQDTKNAVVIGGGVLGLEAAWELKKSKCDVTVLEVMPRLMQRQLDPAASVMLKEVAEKKGVRVLCGVSAEQIEGDGRVTGVRLTDGTVLPADLVVFSCGVRANTAIAQKAGLPVGHAVQVDEQMRTGAADIFACGDCAEFAGVNYAVWSEATEMGRVAGANAAGEPVVYTPEQPAITFNGFETALYAIGDTETNASARYKTVEFSDPVKHTMEKYFFLNNRLNGVILLGDTSKIASVTEAVAQHKQFKELF